MAKNVIKSNPLSETEQAWVDAHANLSIGDLIEEMNARFLSYVLNSLDEKAIDKQVRQDFRKFGSMDKSIVLTNNPDHRYQKA